MLSKDDILKKLSSENYFIDLKSLEIFISDWKIDAVYEDENGVEYYDDISVKKIRRGISLKAQGYPDETIAEKLDDKKETAEQPAAVQPAAAIVPEGNAVQVQETERPQKLRNLTLDISSQTLQMLAEAVAKKISDDIRESDFAQNLIEAGGYKKDNEILSKQIAELLEENKKLSARIETLESKKSFWERLFG